MIEGLKFDISDRELKDHLNLKVKHHEERKAFYKQQTESLQKGNAEGMNWTGGDPIASLKGKMQEHENKVVLFTFFRDHLIPGETYRLEESDLLKLEILSHGRW